MNICVLGCGMQGSVAAQDLNEAGHRVTVFDYNINYLEQLKKMTDIHTRQFDVKKRGRLVKLMKNFDVIVGALPASLGFYTMECAISARVDLVDMSYSARDPFLLHKKAKQKKIRIIPDAGFAPGLSNVLIGEVYQKFGGMDFLRILVGGIPQRPVAPFNYHITWSLSDLIEEYTRPSRIIRNHRLTVVPALSGIEEFSLAKIGRLECFYTDGLRTLMKTMKNVRNMEEKTIRYPGHANLFKTLIECGLLSDQQIRCGKRLAKIRDVTLEFLGETLRKGNHRDLSVLLIEIRKGKKKRKYTCIDRYDEKNKVTSMARMTAYTGSVITQCVKKYPDFGVIPPEYLGMKSGLCQFIKTELKKKNIDIKTN